MKKFISLFLTLVLILSLAACGTTEEEAGKAELEKITVCLDWTPNTNHTGIYVAQALGYYEEAGFDVEIVQPPEDGSTLMCASGQAQYAIDAQDILAAGFALEEPVNVTAVAALVAHNTSGIISRKGEGMDTPKGLENKRYSTWNSPIEMAMMENVVTADGGDFSKVELIPNTITDEAAALAANQTDAVWIYYGWSGIKAEISGFEFDYFNFVDLNPVFDYYTPVLIANNDYIASNPESVKAFLAATKKGYEYAVNNPTEAADILIEGDTTGSLANSRDLVHASQEWLSHKYMEVLSTYEGDTGWGYINPARWDGFYAWLYENNLVEREIPAGFGFTNEYLD